MFSSRKKNGCRMQRRQFLSLVVSHSSAGAVVCGVSGCGTLLHPERRGQLHSNQIDWKIVALDGLGLILFFIPGVVAFAVDFYTGAIYLPLTESYPGYGAGPPVPQASLRPELPLQTVSTESRFQQLTVPRERLEIRTIEEAVTQHVGQPVSLEDDRNRLSTLTQIDQFDERLEQHRSDHRFGHRVRAFLLPWKNALGLRA